MRAPVTVESIHRFMERLGRAVKTEGRVYFEPVPKVADFRVQAGQYNRQVFQAGAARTL